MLEWLVVIGVTCFPQKTEYYGYRFPEAPPDEIIKEVIAESEKDFPRCVAYPRKPILVAKETK